jgi:phosphomannomutase
MKLLSNDFKAAGSDVIEKFREKASNDWGWRVAEENFEGYRFNIDVGGQKTGWVLLRASLHDPLLVLNAESEAYGSMDTITKPIKQWLESEKADVVDASPLAS